MAITQMHNMKQKILSADAEMKLQRESSANTFKDDSIQEDYMLKALNKMFNL